jgi:hypothetical protein
MNRLIVYILLGCVILAILRAVVIALVIAVPLALLVCFVTRPRETLVFVSTMGLLSLARAQPVVFMIFLGVVAIAAVVARLRRKSRRQLLLTDGREHH